MKFLPHLVLTLVLCSAARADEQPFAVSAGLRQSTAGGKTLVVALDIAEGHYVYAESVEIKSEAVDLQPESLPDPVEKQDPFLEKLVAIYEGKTEFVYSVPGAVADPFEIQVSYQGCSTDLCFPPETVTLMPGAGRDAAVARSGSEAAGDAPVFDEAAEIEARMQADFALSGRAAGYLDVEAFIDFLEDAEQGGSGGDDWLAAMFRRRGAWIWAAVLLIVVFGAGLNLTPCVLPMIPINIAIIGAGAAAGSRGRGAALGGAYGAAMAMVYGLLGLAVVLTGSTFGTLNSSPLFNLAIAIVFVVLALAMFDVITIDLSRFQGRAGTGASGRGSFLLAFFMGAIAALLAGACVAPVLISVLLLSTDLYARGAPAALLLPFLLGLGMGLPWPFMGAGLSFLPKPGRWMERVKFGFGVLILGFAFYYGHLAFRLYSESGPAAETAVVEEDKGDGEWMTSLGAALAAARLDNRPVLIDFWASWCKNCIAMDKTTFKDPEVMDRLAPYVKVKYRAEDMKDPATRAMLDIFGVIGLPTYVVLVPQ